MTGMAEALAEHYPNYQWHRDLSENLWTCTSLDCSFASRGFEQAIAHQAAALSAAGFGDVLEQQARIDAVAALAEQWRYKGEFGWGAWQEGDGPDQEGLALDHAAAELRAAITATEAVK